MGKLITAAAVILLIVGIIKLIPGIFAMRGNSAYASGDLEKAMSCFKKAADSGKVKHKISYALMLMRNGDLKEAEYVLNEIALSGGVSKLEKAQAKLYRCMIYQKTDRLDDALEDAEEIYTSIKNTTVYGALGYLRQLKGGAELDFCLEAYDFNSDDRDIIDNLVVAYIRTGNLEKAEELALELREGFPTFIEGFYHSAIIAKQNGEYEMAKTYLDIAEKEGTRNVLTTVSEEEIENLRKELENA